MAKRFILELVRAIWLQWKTLTLALLQQKAGGMLGATDVSKSRTESSADLKQWEINPHTIRPEPAVGPFKGILSNVPQHGQEAEHNCLLHKDECRETGS